MIIWIKNHRLIALMGVCGLVLLVLLLRFQTKFVPEVIFTQPANGVKDVSTKSAVNITFAKNVPESDQEKFFVRFVPGISTSVAWISPNILQLIPQTGLSSNTNYQLSVLFDEREIYRSSFETEFLIVYTPDEVKELTEMALDVNAAFYQTVEVFPFITKLPIVRDNYTVVFDYDREEFRIRLKMPAAAPEATKQEALNGALAEMTTRGINYNDYGYYILYSE